jgi:hypothetical protein
LFLFCEIGTFFCVLLGYVTKVYGVFIMYMYIQCTVHTVYSTYTLCTHIQMYIIYTCTIYTCSYIHMLIHTHVHIIYEYHIMYHVSCIMYHIIENVLENIGEYYYQYQISVEHIYSLYKNM